MTRPKRARSSFSCSKLAEAYIHRIDMLTKPAEAPFTLM
jgi:hypothetical protein